jgi:hypothetical protein
LIDLDLSLDIEGWGDFMGRMDMLSSGKFPAFEASLNQIAEMAKSEWQSYANGELIPGSGRRLKMPDGKYAASIQMKQTGPFAWVVWTDYLPARWLEYGTSSYDMKETHPYGTKGRVAIGKDGRAYPYLIVPFRHFTPDSKQYTGLVKSNADLAGELKGGRVLPSDLYRALLTGMEAGDIAKSKVRNRQNTPAGTAISSTSPNFWGEQIKRRKYWWGSRITDTGHRNLEGMVIMDTASGLSQKYSSYLTFRVISTRSAPDKWIHPGMKAMNMTQHVVANIRDMANEAATAGIKVDMGLTP